MVREKSLIECFSIISDPRIVNKSKHNLLDIIAIVVCGVICSCDSFVDIEEFGKSKQEWFASLLGGLPQGIPSHDTMGRVFSLINSDDLQKSFYEWTQGLCRKLNIKEEVIHVDGKYILASKGANAAGKSGKKSFFGMVNAWSSSAGIALAQLRTDYEKKSEVRATRELLELLNLENCIVTMDAASCQPETTNIIVKKKGDFVVALKKNQRKLHAKVEDLFVGDKKGKKFNIQEKGHGREESRTCQVIALKKSFLSALSERNQEIGRPEWMGLKTVCKVDLERTIKGKRSVETRYYLSSKKASADKMLSLVRSHWEVENKLHWVLDVAFDEDASRVRKGFAGENLAVIRQLSLNLLRQEKTSKRSVKGKRLKCSWQNEYLEKVILGMTL